MANCFAWLRSNKTPRDIKLIIIGLDDAGKTTTVACLQGEPPDGITPTVGFSNANLTINSCNVTLYDLGGGVNVRTVWKKYFADIYGIIFTVDSGNTERLIECKEALQEIFEDPKASGKPIVVFANKQDKEGALDVPTIKEKLNLQNFSDKHSFKFNIFPCSALKGFGKKTDKSIKDGFNWLLREINTNYQKLHEKVETESKIQKEQDAKERKEKWERIRKLREEREKAAKEAGVEDGEDDDNEDDGDVVGGGPFRKIDDQIKITEKREKKEKEDRKKIKEYLDNKAENEVEDETETRQTKKMKGTKKKGKKKTKYVDNEAEDEDDEGIKSSKKTQGSRDSGLSESFEELDRTTDKKNKKKKKILNNEDNNEELDEEEDEDVKVRTASKGKKKKKQKQHKDQDDNDDDGDKNCYSGDDNYRGSKVILVNSSEDVKEIERNSIKRKSNRKPKSKTEDDDESYGNDSNEDNNSRGVDRNCSKEKVHDSRAELFRARSSEDMLNSAESLGEVGKKTKKKKKKKKETKSEGDERDSSTQQSGADLSGIPSKTKKKRKKNKENKKNRTLPNNHCPGSAGSVDALFAAGGSALGNGRLQQQQSWNSKLPPIRENGHPASSSKLEPIELRGRLPDIGQPPRSNGQAW